MWHMTGLQLVCANRDGCHMWGRKFSLFLEHLISLHLWSSWFHPIVTAVTYFITTKRPSITGQDIKLWVGIHEYREIQFFWFYWMFYDHFSARSLLAKLGRWGWWWAWCHMWGRKFSLFLEHLISLHLWSSWFHPIVTAVTYFITTKRPSITGQDIKLWVGIHEYREIQFFDFIECFKTTFLRAHSWLNWVDEDDDEHDEVGLKEKPEDTRYIKKITSK